VLCDLPFANERQHEAHTLNGGNMSQAQIEYPQALTAKYQPQTLDSFIGLERPKKILAKFAAQPYANSFLFAGPSGTGKTTMALALAKQLQGEVIHIPSQHCTVTDVEDAIRRCWYVPMTPGGFHVVLVDEADQMTDKAQLLFLSKLDATGRPPNTIFIFTCNETDKLQDRFLSRCMVLQFQSHGMAKEAAGLLERIWHQEAGDTAEKPNFLRMVQDSKNNVRDAVNSLQVELLSV
jgi:replication factor C small subunit